MNEQDIKILFGRKIKILRNKLNVTQFTLGEMADINQRQVALIEAGKSFPSLKTIVRFLNIFSCSLTDLFSFDNLKDTELLKEELHKMVEEADNSSVRVLYTITRDLI